MPASSGTQARTARMALAYKRGKPLKAFPPGARAAVKSMAGMNEDSLRHYTSTKRRGSILTGKG